jgi:hypothetical protein
MEYERTEDLETDLALLSRPHTLADYGRRESDPRRYIDALERPYLVLDDEHAQLGDHVIILAPERKRLCHAVIGEHRQVRHAVGSQALVELLNGGSARSTEVIGLVFPRTGLGQGLIPSLDRVASVGRKLWERAISDGPAEGQLWSEVLACAFEGLRLAGPIEDVSPRR